MKPAKIPEAAYTRLRALLQKKMREKYGEFLVEGKRLVAEAIHSGWDTKFVCVEEERADQLPFLTVKNSFPVYALPEKEFSTISATEHSQGVVAVVEQKHASFEQIQPENGFVIALDAIADPGNVGTIIRSADWFGAGGVLLGKGCAELYNPKTVRGTMGALFHLPVAENVNLLAALPGYRKKGFRIYAATTSDTPVNKNFSFSPKAVLLIGSEAVGITPELLALADSKITIKKYGKGESLNAAMAATVVLAMAREFAAA